MSQPSAANAEVRAALEKVLASEGFSGAGRLGPFLRFLVERAQAGETDRLKESVLGFEVFGRPSDYDPRTDPIVRVEARRLRQRLEEYYAGSGSADAVRIHLPKGGYVPIFEEKAKAKIRSLNWRIPAGIAGLALIGIFLGYWQFRYMRRIREAPVAAVAVLPFADLGTAPDTEYFSAGLTEELTDRLSRIPGLKVVPRSVMAQFKGHTEDLFRIANSVRASVLVDGSVRQQGDRVRVTARLLNPADGYQLWSQTYERKMKDIFAIQDEIAQAIANALRVQVRSATSPSRATANLEAYNAYLRGRYYANMFTEDGLKQSVEHFEEALRLQPDYAPAAAGLSQSYAFLGYYRVLPADAAWTNARSYAEKAIALDPSLAEAYAVLGLELGWHEWNWKQAETAFKKAQELDPSSVAAHSMYAIAFLLPQGRLDEATAELKKALELDPLSTGTNFVAAFALLGSGRTEEAVAQYRRTLDLKNVHPDMYWDYGMALGYAGRFEEARQAIRKSRELRGVNPDNLGGLEAWFVGDKEKARRDAPGVERAVNEGRTKQMDAARYFAVLGDKQKALDHLERAVDIREEQALWIKVDPRLESLRNEPRYAGLVRRIGLDDAVK
jgi:TolB-like protein/Flp pilus assembly protein TadD